MSKLIFLNIRYQFVRNILIRSDAAFANHIAMLVFMITARSCMQSNSIAFIVNYFLLKMYQLWVLCSALEIFLIENQQSATDDRRGPCLYVDSKRDGAYIKVTGCNETDEKQNWVYTLKGQIMVSLVNSNDIVSPSVLPLV